MWHCDQLEKFAAHAEARFVKPSAQVGTAPEVRRVQYTLDVATHPMPGRWYELVRDAETKVESFVLATPKPPQPAPATPTAAAAGGMGAPPDAAPGTGVGGAPAVPLAGTAAALGGPGPTETAD